MFGYAPNDRIPFGYVLRHLLSLLALISAGSTPYLLILLLHTLATWGASPVLYIIDN